MIKDQKNNDGHSDEKSFKNEEDSSRNSRKSSNSFSEREYFPLMSGNFGPSYRPVRKKPCGPCGGGGCG